MADRSQPFLLTAHKCRRDSGILFRLTLPTVAPGQTPGALRFVSLALHIPHKRMEAPQERFSEEVSGRCCVRKRVSQKLSCEFTAHADAQQNSRRTTSLDVLAELNNYSKCMQTSSTRDYASHRRKPEEQALARKRSKPSMRWTAKKGILRFVRDLGCGLAPAKRLDLLILLSASTLQVFQFIRQLVTRSFGREDEEGAWAGCVTEVWGARSWRSSC